MGAHNWWLPIKGYFTLQTHLKSVLPIQADEANRPVSTKRHPLLKLNPHQSGFTKHHSTETLLVSLYHKLVSAVSRQPSASFLLMSPRHLCCIKHYRSYNPPPATFILVRRVWRCSTLVPILVVH